MAARCDICKKGPVSGGNIVHSGLTKKSGGIGLNLVKNTKRRFMPNLQRVRAHVNGRNVRLSVCTSCLRSGKVQKAKPRQYSAAAND